MGQLCCFPFSRGEEKINLIPSSPSALQRSQKRGEEPDDEELLSLSKRLVEEAVLKALQQYMEETQQGVGVGGAVEKGPPPPGDDLHTGASK